MRRCRTQQVPIIAGIFAMKALVAKCQAKRARCMVDTQTISYSLQHVRVCIWCFCLNLETGQSFSTFISRLARMVSLINTHLCMRKYKPICEHTCNGRGRPPREMPRVLLLLLEEGPRRQGRRYEPQTGRSCQHGERPQGPAAIEPAFPRQHQQPHSWRPSFSCRRCPSPLSSFSCRRSRCRTTTRALPPPLTPVPTLQMLLPLVL